MENLKQETFVKTYNAWKEFIETGELLQNTVRSEILSSWERCRKIGVDPFGGVCSDILDGDKLKKLLIQNEELINVARPFMYKLYNFLQGSGFIVMLNDADGYILETFGDKDIVRQASTLNFVIGACWQERCVGTNSMGVVINTKKPIQVSGAEHYCEKSHSWTCSAAPILDDSNRLIGIFNVSGYSSGTHSHTLGMVVAAVEAIEHQMRLRRQNHQLLLINQRLTNIFTTISDAVIFVDKTGIIKEVNPAAKSLLGNLTDKILEDRIIRHNIGQSSVFSHTNLLSSAFNEVELSFKTKIGKVDCIVSGSPIKDESNLISGTVMIIRPMERVHRLVNRYSSGQASFRFSDIVGQSEQMKEAIRIASLAADNNGTILLQGESGTGKEVFAQAIHNASARYKGPFVAVNCGAIPRELVGSELFGYSEGAFTGAKRGGRPGKFELASGGTLFLDEIGDMPLEQQVALLRVLQERRVVRVGDDSVIPIDVRVICATNRDLQKEIERFNFRQDLFYRINVINIRIPPLREHPQDIPLLIGHFLEKLRQRGMEIKTVDAGVYERLSQYSWPGNVRELQNIVERMVTMADGAEITIEHLPDEIAVKPEAGRYTPEPSSRITVDAVRSQKRKMTASEECKQIQDLLIKYGGNVTKVANEIGLSRNTLYRKLRQYNIKN